MKRLNNFWGGVRDVGVGVGGLAGAYTLAASWGSASSLFGLFAGACGIVCGAVAGAFLAALILPVAIFVAALVVDTILELSNTIFSGVQKMCA